MNYELWNVATKRDKTITHDSYFMIQNHSNAIFSNPKGYSVKSITRH